MSGPSSSSSAPLLRRNVEVKHRLRSLDAAAAIARGLVRGEPEILRQTDTYFLVPHGRLKLRETPGRVAQLVWYDRPDDVHARTSRYQLIDVLDGAALKQALSAALGVRCVVTKTRWLLLRESVRIHLDRVEELGDFLELEAVLAADAAQAAGAMQVAELLQSFQPALGDAVEQSYSELLLEQG